MTSFSSGLSGAILVNAITYSATSLTLSGVPAGIPAGVYPLKIDSELMLGTNAGSSSTFTSLARGQEGTTAAAHRAGVTVRHTITGAALNAKITNPMTTAADLIVGGTSGVPARLAKGSDGQVLTVDPSTHLLVWATPAGGAFVGASVYFSGADQNLPATSNTLLAWNTAVWDTNSLFSGGSPTKLTVPAGKTGKWLASGNAEIYGALAGTGTRELDLWVNGSMRLEAMRRENSDATEDNAYSFCLPLNLTAGDYVEVNFYNSASVALSMSNSSSSATFSLTFLGA